MATKKSPVKKKPNLKTTKAKKVVSHRSFKLSSNDTPFFTFAITQQTFYWAIISGAVLALGLWIGTIQVNVNKIYDQIETNSSALEDVPTPKMKP